jgi:hypothetical protein
VEGPSGDASGALTRTPARGDTGVEEEQPVMMSRKRHVVDGRWATQSRSVIEQKSEKIPKINWQQLSCRTFGCA